MTPKLWPCILVALLTGAIYDAASANEGTDTLNSTPFPGRGSKAMWLKAAQYYNLGNRYRKSNQPQKALENYKRAVSIYPDDPMFYNNLSLQLAQLHHFREAELHARKAVKLSPITPYRISLAKVLAESGKIGEARNILVQAASQATTKADIELLKRERRIIKDGYGIDF